MMLAWLGAIFTLTRKYFSKFPELICYEVKTKLNSNSYSYFILSLSWWNFGYFTNIIFYPRLVLFSAIFFYDSNFNIFDFMHFSLKFSCTVSFYVSWKNAALHYHAKISILTLHIKTIDRSLSWRCVVWECQS